jgi:hypothetical protein
MLASSKIRLLLAAVLLTGLVATPAAAQCIPFLCYVDLNPGGGAICPQASTFTDVSIQQNGAATTCTDGFQSAVVEVQVPEACSAVHVWVEYHGDPQGWTVNIGDSATNDGFGGDAGTLPAGQNAEVQVLDEILTVFNAADNPSDVDALATQHLALRDGALNFVVQDQYLSWGQQYTALQTPDLERLFFLPPNPAAPANRTIYVGLNRTIANPARNGCGARRALIHVN